MDSITRILKLLGHPDRLRILALLRHEELTVSELVSVLELSQPRVTQYVRSLEEGGVVERLREGSWVFSRLSSDDTVAMSLLEAVLSKLPSEDPVLCIDRRRLVSIRAAREDQARQFFADVANNQDRLSHEFLPQAPVEAAIRNSLGDRRFDYLVDLGTGSGRMLELLADRVARGIGIDLSPDMLRVARYTLSSPELAHLSVQQADLMRTPLKDGVADLVILHQVLHHLDRPAAALQEAARLLSADGTLLVVDFAEHKREEFRDRFAHRRLGYSGEELSALMLEQGFASVDVVRVSAQSETYPDLMIWTALAKTYSAEFSRASMETAS